MRLIKNIARLMRRILQLGTSPDEDCIVVDFFAGTGTMMDALFAQNAEDGGKRRGILVQLPEPLQGGAATGLATIAEVTKARVRGAAKRLRAADSSIRRADLGFRVFKLDTSNIRAWNPDPDDLIGTLLEHTEHLVPGRTEQDVLYEVLLKLGLDLSVPIETRTIAGRTVHSVGAGTLMVCLADGITRETAEPLAQGISQWQKALAPVGGTRLVFKDSGFVDDVAKTNLAAILEQNGIERDNIRSL